MPSPQEVENLILQGIPNAKVAVEDLKGDGAHFDIKVICSDFSGKNMIEQHQMIYAALGDAMKDEIHAVQLSTSEN